jgi:hypothetical protein
MKSVALRAWPAVHSGNCPHLPAAPEKVPTAGMRKDRNYDSLREREGFKKLLAELEEKGKK